MVTELPAHIADADVVEPTVGKAFTVIVRVDVFEHVFASVPVTVYVVVVLGVNATPLFAPPVQLYDVAPVPLMVTDVPAHTVDAVVVEPTVGNTFTVIVRVAVFEQVFASVPVTV